MKNHVYYIVLLNACLAGASLAFGYTGAALFFSLMVMTWCARAIGDAIKETKR